MKKVYFIFSLLLMILGINTAYASVTWNDPISDPNTLTAGSHIVIHTNRATNEATQSYKFFSAYQDSLVYTTMSELALERFCSFTMETATGKTIKGQQAYYLKNDYNGRYISYVYDEKTSHVDGFLELQLVFTDDVNKALAVIITPATTGAGWFNYTLTDDDKKEVTETTMMIVGECAEQDNCLIAFNSNFGDKSYAATYGDWATWWKVSNATVTVNYFDDLYAMYQKVKDVNYLGGTAPGCYDATLVARYNEAKKTAEKISFGGSDEAEAKVALENLENVYYELQNATSAPVQEGYFRISSAFPSFISKQDSTAIKTIYATNDGHLNWKNLDKEDATMVWQFIDRKDGTWLMYNIGTGQYVNGSNGSAVGSPWYSLGNDSTGNAIKFTDLGQSQFNIAKSGMNSMHAGGHNDGAGASGNVVAWNGGLNGASAWYITNVDSTQIPGFEAVGNQNTLNRNLELLYNEAYAKYQIGSSFDIDTLSENWLVTTADYEKDKMVAFSNADHNEWHPDALDGAGIPGLLDNNESTFWGSCWSDPQPDTTQFLQFKLNKAVSGFAVYLTKRSGQPNQATQLTFYVSNDTTDVNNWVKAGTISGLPASTSTTDLTYQSNGIELDGSYQYVRVYWTSDKGFTHFTGFHFEEATLSPKCQNATMGDVAKNLKAELSKAETLINSGKATQDAINALQDAYNKYKEKLADPTELKAKLDSIQGVYNKAASPNMKKTDGTDVAEDSKFKAGYPGVYTDAAKAALKSVMDDVQDYLDANESTGAYNKEDIQSKWDKLNEAWATFKASEPQIQMTSATTDGIWYKISSSQHYYDYTGNTQDTQTSGNTTYIRKGRLYVGVKDLDTEALNNYSINVTGDKTLEELKVGEDMALWRFVNVGDTAVAIQNKGTGLYIGAKTGGNAGLSITPVTFNIQELGYATFLFNGKRLDGTATSPLHVQTNGQVLVFWDNYDLGGGSCFDIEPTSNAATQAYTLPNIEEVVSGRLYAKCYPVDITTVGDEKVLFGKTYQIATIDQEKKELTLTGSMDEISAGQPFFYIAGGNTIEATTDTILMYLELTDNKVIAKNPRSNNGLIGTYYATTPGEGYGILKDEEGVQIIAAATATESTGWNTAYINSDLITNAEQPGEIKVPLEGNLETAIKDAIMDAQIGNVNVYSIDGILIKKNVKASEATKGLAKGIYIVGKKKIAIK